MLYTNKKNRSVLCVGYTDDVKKRINQHQKGLGSLFTKRYNAIDLVYFEGFEEKKMAKSREKQLKNWHKEWKWNLIKESNPNLETISIN
ncbi:MAG: GIY-YIG nuclease family protein [Algibacter sp.]|uniref:GIY-YIG nuclease family protein n=1 Tax=Algibacter sp. TaxID=1872428 RepID=UPI00261D13E5|nr:GIY-YIG nuclease family protein [Algibacter sp.]MDG1730864.1 GIY-YIG nuclease family protein [Algibacter sp.]MDG2179366.1 GIY-YIG nuclease family protein [Algibacter sp.]